MKNDHHNKAHGDYVKSDDVDINLSKDVQFIITKDKRKAGKFDKRWN